MVLLEKVEKLLDGVDRKLALSILTILSVATIIFFLHYPTMANFDTSIYSLPAYHLAFNGTFSNEPCNFFGGERTYWQPPLWFMLQVPIYKLFGYSFANAHILPLITFICFIVLAWKLIPKENRITALCLLLSLSVINTAITNRPDVLMGIFSLLIAFSNNPFIIAIAAGLALNTHSIGVPLAALAFAKIALDYPKSLPVFFLTVGIICIPFGIYILQDPTDFASQFFGNNIQKSTLFDKITNVLTIITFMPMVLLLATDGLKKEKIFAVMLLIYLVLFSSGLSRFFKYGIIIAPIVLASVNLNDKKLGRLIGLIILANIALLAFNLVVDIHAALNSESIYECIAKYHQLNVNNDLCLSSELFIVNPSAPCSSECKKMVGIPRHLKYSNLTNYTTVDEICKINKFDYRLLGISDYSFVIIEKNS